MLLIFVLLLLESTRRWFREEESGDVSVLFMGGSWWL